MKDYGLIVTDTSPLITLAKADELDLLLRMQIPVEVPDVVFFEAAREDFEDGRRLRAWVNDNKDQVRVVPTDRGVEWQALRDQNITPKGYGELAAGETIDMFVRLNPGRVPIILYEDTDVEKLRGLPAETELITTGTYLIEMEAERQLQSAAHVLDEATKAGRNVERQRDQPRNPDLADAFRTIGMRSRPKRDREMER